MYFTLQLRLRIDEEDRKELKMFEMVYLEELQQLISHMERLSLHHPFSFYTYSERIHKASHWAMYQIADKIAIAHKEKRQGSYARSGTWSPASYKIQNAMLYLQFGEQFQTAMGKYPLAMDEHQERLLRQGKHLRLDLTHDEYFWFCNIVILAKDT